MKPNSLNRCRSVNVVFDFITIEQYNLFEVLTILPVMEIPPTLAASTYGINFKNMPERTWPGSTRSGLPARHWR
jgi:Mg2+ and Co2+ transporter CorA